MSRTMDHLNFILNTSASYFNIVSQAEHFQSNSYVRDFLDGGGQSILTVTTNDSRNGIQFQNRLPDDCQNVLIFYKNGKSQNQFSDRNASKTSDHIGILTLEGGIVKSIYNSISNIFLPSTLNKNECSADLIEIIDNLRTNLSVTLGVAETGISSIKDEVYFWRQKTLQSPTKADRDAAKKFQEYFENLNEVINDYNSTRSSNRLRFLDDFLDRSQYILDEIWRNSQEPGAKSQSAHQYPQNRMISVIDVLSTFVINCCIDDMNQEDIWSTSSINLNSVISLVIDTINNWIQICDSLTRLFWTNCEQHTWVGKPYISNLITKFKARIEEILDIKQVHKQISLLNAEDETIDLKSRDYFYSFRDINIFDTTPIGEKYWNIAKQKFEQSLSHIDEKIALNIKYSIQNNLNNPRQVIHIFSKYENILKRQKIKDTLKVECDQLYQSVLLFLKSLNNAMVDTKSDCEDYEITPIVSDIKWFKMIEYQLIQVNQICDNVLNDHENYDQLKKTLSEFQNDLESQIKVNYEKWCENSLSSVMSGELVLKDNEPVVKFEKKERQLMTVTYNPKLLYFCQDIKYLKNFGFTIPKELVKYGTIGRKYIKYAKNLQQIATFHNTIGDKIIPIQRPILLKNAVELSNLVRSESVSWNDEESVKRYIGVLQEAINKLSRDNMLLTGYHETMKKSIMKLMNTDLLKQADVWKEELKSLRDSIASLERKGYENLQLFKLHWDYQLYKALEYQLILFLIDSKEKLPSIHIDIVFRQQQLQFRPPLEEIRHQYYSQIRKIIEMPLNFHGFSDHSNSIFRVMVERNRSRFKSLYDRAERNFKRLCEFRDLWLPWVSLGCVNLDNLCKVHLNNWEQWDKNFRSCKNFSQKIAKIQNTEEVIDCFVVNLSPIRSHIEYICRNFWETLAMSLRSSILEDISVLHEYISSSLNVLQHIPSDEAGIVQASVKYERIVNHLPDMTDLFKNVQSKNTCLAGWCKENVSSMESINVQWEKLLPLIENHNILLQGQLETIKENLLTQINGLNDDAEKFLIKWEDTLKDLEANPNSDFDLFKERKIQWETLIQKREQLIQDCEKFNVTFAKDLNDKFRKIEEDVKKHGEQWVLFEDFLVEHETVENEEWSVFRRKPYIFKDFLNKWENKTANLITIPAIRIKKTIENYRSFLPTLTMLQSDSLNDKHFANIFSIVGASQIKSYHDMKLTDVLKHAFLLAEHSNEIKSIVHLAYSEQIVRQAINELEQWGFSTTLKLFSHSDNKGNQLMLIKDFQEPLNKIGDNQCLLQSAKNTSAVESYSDQVELWENKLNTLSFILSNMCQIQKKWLYLEPIFSTGTLQNRDNIFDRIDKDFRYIMKEISMNSKILSLIKINNITIIIESLLGQLQRCQNALTAYMTTKRDLFPRFYFLSDDDLLEILGQSSKENIIQKHISKLFPGIQKLDLSTIDSKMIIKGIQSADGDYVRLHTEVSTNDAVENWLNELDQQIKATLQNLIKECLRSTELSLETVQRFPMQVLCLVNSIHFTGKMEKSIISMSLQNLLSAMRNQITEYSKMLKNNKDSLTRLKIRSLLFDLVHQVTTTEYLIKHNVTNLNDWHFLQQIKFYCNSKTDVISVKMVNAEFEYSYEFLGNYNKLVYTSLTHNCYLTLTQSMYLGLGGNPFGKAGTGKTESVKSLGAMLGRMVLVFNCNENIDTSAMALILTGLAKCGSWGCFDEFNRLQEDTLSAIAMLIQPIQNALKEKQNQVELLDKKIALNRHCGIFVTLNPAGEEYGGRNQLPSNLQALFRPIVMQEPEPKEIAKVMLFIEGFQHAEEIGKRIVELFDLSNKLLSSQRHYDWGLRELKTVLNACGKSLNNVDTKLSFDDEMKLVVQSLKPNVMSKLTVQDCKSFEMLLEDVFPQLDLSLHGNDEFKNKISETFQLMRLKPNQRQIDKCVELNEQLSKRIGVAIIGKPNSGKSTVINVLKNALTAMSKTIRTYIISPKSMSRAQLLGYLDVNTRQWHDGVLTSIAITVNSEPPEITSWIICDGDVDPEWIEALNSVLDDNKLLTLPSGWRIQFGNNVNFIFETHDVSNASPATISRMGIINMSSEDLSMDLIIDPWVEKLNNKEVMQVFMDKYFESVFDMFKDYTHIFKHVSKISVVRNVLLALNGVDDKEEFLVNLTKAFNGMIETSDRNKFTNAILDNFNVYVNNPLQAEHLNYNKFRNATELHVDDDFDAIFGNNENNIVRTASIKSHGDILRNYLKCSDHPPFLIVGPSGNGKSLLVNSVVSEFSGYQIITVNCSAQLTAHQVLYSLQKNSLVVSGIKGKEYKPKQSRLVLFLKNIDLCPVDAYGSSEVIELLLQIINRSGFYSDNLEWVSVQGLQICGTLSDLNKQNLSPRFLSKSNILLTSYPNENDMQKIVINFLNKIYKMKQKISVKKEQMAEIIIGAYQEIREKFTADSSNHYRFTPKMIEKWIMGLAYYPDEYFTHGFFYEFSKVFGDRLMSIAHLNSFYEILRQKAKYFGSNYNDSDTFFISTSARTSTLQYSDAVQWKEMIQRNLPICNSETATIDIPVTSEVMKAVSSIVRALCRSETNICLSGKIGAGRFESTVLACTILNIKIFYPQVTKDYGLNDFYNDLKLSMQICGIENEVAILFIDHTWINFLNDILKSCEAFLEGSIIDENLFGEDLETIANNLKSAAQLEGYQDSLISYFLKRVRNNLHLVISLECTTNNFQEILKMYPALYSKTEFVWIQEFSEQTNHMLCEDVIKLLESNNSLSGYNDTKKLSMKYFNAVLAECGAWKESPKRSIQLIKTYYYTHVFNEKRKSKQQSKLQLGIEKLSDAYKYVAKLKKEAEEKERALAEKRQLANEALGMISTTMKNANDQKSDLVKLKTKTEESSEILKQRKLEIEQELSLVEPLLKEASTAVGQIKSEALAEIRSLRAPPETIRDILEAVLKLMGVKDTSWNSMKSFLAKRGFKEEIQNFAELIQMRSFNTQQINFDNCVEVEKLIKNKRDSFDLKNAKRASAAAAPLASWVLACVKYAKVVQSIKPLEKEQNELRRNLEKTENQMKSLSSGIDDVTTEVKRLSEQLNVYTQEAAVLEIKLEDTRNILKSTEDLVDKLSSEYNNWNEEYGTISEDIKNLDKQSFLIALNLTHFSHMLQSDKQKFIQNINERLHTKFSVKGCLYTDQESLVWQSFGLGADRQSVENAALITQFLNLPFGTTPIPLLLDPTGNAGRWLKNYLKNSNCSFEVLHQNDDRFTYNLELSIRFGKILIIDDIAQDFPAPLISVISMRIHSRFNKKMLHIGNKFIDLHENFKLIMLSSVVVKSLNGDLNANVTLMPFTLTISGLTDQLLSKWISIKHPEMEKKRIELLEEEGTLIKQKIDFQDKLLEELSHAEGDILKNEKLLSTLNNIKESSSLIEKSLEESFRVRAKLMENYEQYKEICQRSAQFYMGISKIYDLNIVAFTNKFLEVMSMQKDIDSNFGDQYNNIVKKTYLMISRSIPKSELNQLGLNICKYGYSNKVPDVEWEMFIFNFVDSDHTMDADVPKWIKKELVPKVVSLKHQHPEFYEKLKLDDDYVWSKFTDNQDTSPPAFPEINVSEFQKLLVYQIFRPDLLLDFIGKTTSNLLGLQSISVVGQSHIKQILNESTNQEPILIVATSGTDPTSDLKEIAKNSIGVNNFNEIYVGKGQENHLDLIKTLAETNNQWICVKNIHLMPQFITKIESKLKSAKVDEGFKIIYICETDQNIPKNFLNKCKKLLIEPPNGIKYKICNLLEQYQPQLKEKRDYRSIKLFVALFALHSVLQERRTFIPQGWCKWYEFCDADMKAAIDFIMAINKTQHSQKDDWTVLKGLIEKIVYGGRVDNLQDFAKLVNFIDEYFDTKILNAKWTPRPFNVTLNNSNNFDDYYNTFIKMENFDSKPEMFGLSALSSVSRNIATCRNLLKDLRKIYFNIDDSGNYDKRIKPLINLWKKLTNNLNVSTLVKMKNTSSLGGGNIDPWRLFKLSEITLALNLYQTINETLQRLNAVIHEMHSITDTEMKILLVLSDNQVPYEFRKLWSGPKLASDYLKSVVIRIQKTFSYVNSLEDSINEANFSEIFNVDSLLSTIKLVTSRDMKISASDLVLESFTDQNKYSQMKNISKNIVKVAPLLLDGLNFSYGRLTLSSDFSSTNVTDEIYLHFVPTASKHHQYDDESNICILPLYSTYTREKLLCTIKLPTSLSKEEVIYSGGALIVTSN